MRRRRFPSFRAFFFVAIVGITPFVVPPSRASALDCGDRLITTGDPIGYVRAFCGDPISIVAPTYTRSEVMYGGGVRAGTVAIPVEVWTYDFGEERMMVQLTFQGGRLIFEQVLGRGTAVGHPPDGAGNGHAYYTHQDSRAYHRHR